jgi:hypothetical protein
LSTQVGLNTDRTGPTWCWKQERQRRAVLPLVRVPPPNHRDGRPVAGVPANDLGDRVQQLGRHRDHPFPVGLGRRDHQQGHHLAVGPVEPPQGQVRQLQQLLVPDPCEA